MRVRLDGYAWIERAAFTTEQWVALREHLTVRLTAKRELPLYVELPQWVGVPREYYLPKRKPGHHVEDATCAPSWKDLRLPAVPWSSKVSLRAEQVKALELTQAYFRLGPRGGLLIAKPGWGKTLYACGVIDALRVPALIVVTKEFFVDQWRSRLEMALPGLRVGVVQSDRCEYDGYHVSIGLVQSLSQRRYSPAFYKHFGLLLVDEAHYMGAEEWAPVPGLFPARWRLGLTATPRRADGAERAFEYHIGQRIYEAKEQSLPFKVRYVFSEYGLPKAGRLQEKIVTDYLTSDSTRTDLVAFQILEAARAGRKSLVLSSRLAHLRALDAALRARCAQQGHVVPSLGYYVGGRTPQQLVDASECQVILATYDQAAVGLDIPSLDTLFLTTPARDIEQAVGRIQRPFEGKKTPVVVDVRDDRVPSCREAAQARIAFYHRNGAA